MIDQRLVMKQKAKQAGKERAPGGYDHILLFSYTCFIIYHSSRIVVERTTAHIVL